MSNGDDLSIEGRVVAVAADRGHQFSKPFQGRIVLVEGHGRRRRRPRRRVRPASLSRPAPTPASQPAAGHLIPFELFASLSEAGFEVRAGELGENITTADLDLERMPLGTFIELGPTAIVELTGHRTPCVLIDRFRAGLKRRVHSSAETGPAFRCGVLGVVRVGGAVVAGDNVRVRLPPTSFLALPGL